MKRIVNIGFIVVILYANLGYIVTYLVNLKQIKTEQFEQIRRTQNYDNCVKFVLNDITLKHIRFEFWNKKEFEYNGNMYDIVTSSVEKGKKVIYALMDSKETSFWENFVNFMNNKMLNKTGAIYYFKFISNLQPLSPFDYSKILKIELENQRFENHSSFSFQNFVIDILKPPPNFKFVEFY